VILLLARERPNRLVTRSFEDAAAELAGIVEKIGPRPLQSFDRVARVHTEDPYSKVRGGDVGFFPRRDDRMRDVLLDAAFELAENQISEPVRLPEGVAVVRVTDIEPTPGDTVLLERLRSELADSLVLELVEAAAIEIKD
jgi:parvulin-like peptidyl-prolyl isomerase